MVLVRRLRRSQRLACRCRDSYDLPPPKGPDGAWKTGQRVPFDGYWADQYGAVTFHERRATFPPYIDRRGECAMRHLIEDVAAA